MVGGCLYDIAIILKVLLKDCMSADWDVERMSKVTRTNVVWNLMVCTRQDTVCMVSFVKGSTKEGLSMLTQ